MVAKVLHMPLIHSHSMSKSRVWFVYFQGANILLTEEGDVKLGESIFCCSFLRENC